MTKDKKTVAIIGAGIVGVSTALWLQRDGHDVILIDKTGPAEGTSYGNAGLLASAATLPVTMPGLLRKAPRMALDPAQPLFLRWAHLPWLIPWLIPYLRHANAASARARADAMLPIIGDSLADHQALSRGTGAEAFVVPTEYIYAYSSRAQYDADSMAWGVRKTQGFEWTVVEGKVVQEYDPLLSDVVACGAVLKDQGRIRDPGQYVKALAAHAETQGARILKADVTDVVRENGHVTGVRANGQTIACDAAVLTAGVWSKPLAERLGLRVPLHPESGFHLELWEPSHMPRSPMMLVDGKFAITPMDGRIRLAGMVAYGGLDAAPTRAPFDLFLKHLKRVMPGLTWQNTREWMGHRPAIVDSVPLIGEVPSAKGAFVGFGHDHVGLTGGPKTGRILAQMISGKTPNLDLSPYAPDRFGRS
ncbi:MAG: FAD-binding oxidoreductase [Pseudomonadota bacterium]